MNAPDRIVIVGATSRIAELCARRWAESGARHFSLAGRDGQRLEAIAADLRARAPGAEVECAVLDFIDPARIAAFAQDAQPGQRLDLVLIAHGSLPDQGACERDLAECARALEVNALSPALFAQAFAQRLEAAGHGTLALIGSVAGDRGRKSNYVYGAAKGLVTRLAQGLQHRLANSPVCVVLIKPGPTDTPMTAALKSRGAPLAPAEDVAAAIVRGIAARRRVVYAPAKWSLIMMVIRHLPWAVFRRMDI